MIYNNISGIIKESSSLYNNSVGGGQIVNIDSKFENKDGIIRKVYENKINLPSFIPWGELGNYGINIVTIQTGSYYTGYYINFNKLPIQTQVAYYGGMDIGGGAHGGHECIFINEQFGADYGGGWIGSDNSKVTNYCVINKNGDNIMTARLSPTSTTDFLNENFNLIYKKGLYFR